MGKGGEEKSQTSKGKSMPEKALGNMDDKEERPTLCLVSPEASGVET